MRKIEKSRTCVNRMPGRNTSNKVYENIYNYYPVAFASHSGPSVVLLILIFLEREIHFKLRVANNIYANKPRTIAYGLENVSLGKSFGETYYCRKRSP